MTRQKRMVIGGIIIFIVIILFCIDYSKSILQNKMFALMLGLSVLGLVCIFMSSHLVFKQKRRLLLAKIVLMLSVAMICVGVVLMIVEHDFKSYFLLILAMVFTAISMIGNIYNSYKQKQK